MDEKQYRIDFESHEEIEESDSIDFWEKKQRELVTSVVDYNLSSIAELIEKGVINTSPKYQRRFRWDAKRQSKLIESFLMNVPIPPVFLNEDSYGEYSVIDGKQRLTAISEFMRGRLRLQGLTVFSDINGQTFDELPPKLQRVIRTRPTIRAIIILRQSDEDVKFEVFQRLNTGGVTLNPQEIRNSAYPGALNDLILELSEHKLFHRLLGVKSKAQSAIYQEMRDAELVLRFFTFRDTWADFRGGMKRQMDHFIAANQKIGRAQLRDMREDFLDTLTGVEAAFDDCAFRRWIPEKGIWRKQVLAAAYDAQMFACRGREPEQMRASRTRIIGALRDLFQDGEFRKAVDAATNTPNFFRSRIRIMSETLDRVVGR